MSEASPAPVGIGMTLHNRATWLREAIDSLLAQSYGNFNLVLLDDGSTDETEAIARSYEKADRRVKYIRFPERRGMVSAWQTTFERASAHGARYFAWASDHDKWHPRWLETLLQVLESSPSVMLAYPLTQRIDPLGEPLSKPARQFETFGISDRSARWALLNGSDAVAAGDMVYGLMRTDAVRDAGIFRAVLSPDRLLIAELTLQGEIRQVPELLWYRRQFSEGSVARQRFTLFAPGTPTPSRLTPPWYMHARSLWEVYGGGAHPRVHLSGPTAVNLITRYSAAYASRHYAKSSVQKGILTVLGWPRWIYKRLKHAVLLGVYGLLLALRQLGITPIIERVCERLTGRPRPWRRHA
jgi:glycosyltransferase involved in cell wall biosynthesis